MSKAGITLSFVLSSKTCFIPVFLPQMLVSSKELRIQHAHTGMLSCHTISEHWWKTQLPKGYMKCAHLCIHCVQMTLPKCSRTIQFAKILCTSAISHVLKVNDNVPLQICSSHSLGLQPRQSNQLSLLSVPLLFRVAKKMIHTLCSSIFWVIFIFTSLFPFTFLAMGTTGCQLSSG